MDITENKPEEKNIQEQNAIISTTVDQSKEESPKTGKDWERFREARALERKQAEEISKQAEKSAAEAAALRAAMESLLNKNQQTQNHQYSEEQDESEEQRIEKKVIEAISRREMEMEKQRKQKEHEQIPERLQSNFQDFNSVCNSENLDYLEYHYPEVAEAFKQAPDSYNKWASIYKAVKRFVPNTDSRRDQKKADSNFSKPQSMSTPASAATSSGNISMRIDDSRKAENWARMQRALKGLS